MKISTTLLLVGTSAMYPYWVLAQTTDESSVQLETIIVVDSKLEAPQGALMVDPALEGRLATLDDL